jgi:hypothetical protein
MTDWIKEYTNRGWVVHPLAGPKDPGDSPGKRPLLKGWQFLKETPQLSLFKPKCNIGLVCGKASGVMVIDYDSLMFAHNENTGTPVSFRTTGRGHVFFKYDPEIKSQKHHLLGIEILSDGSNAVLPPSIHASGDVYKWVNTTVQIQEIPESERRRLTNLFNTETELKQIINKCRYCFKKVLKDYPANIPDVHGSDGRLFMLAICTDLMALGAKEAHIKMFSKLVYREKYDSQRTTEELKGIAPRKTWRCETLREKLPGLVSCEECPILKFKHKDISEQMSIRIPASVKVVKLLIER